MKSKTRCFCLFLIVCCFFTSFAYAEDDIETLTKQALALAADIESDLINANSIMASATSNYDSSVKAAKDKWNESYNKVLKGNPDTAILPTLMAQANKEYEDAVAKAEQDRIHTQASANSIYSAVKTKQDDLDKLKDAIDKIPTDPAKGGTPLTQAQTEAITELENKITQLNDTITASADKIDNASQAAATVAATQSTSVKTEYNANNATQVNDPILSTSGRYLFTETDISISVENVNYSFGRYYNSGRDLSDLLGNKWYHTLDTRVIRNVTPNYLATYNSVNQAFKDSVSSLNMLNTTRTNIYDKYQEAINDVTESIKALKEHIRNSNNEVRLILEALKKTLTSRLLYLQSEQQREDAAYSQKITDAETTVKKIETEWIRVQHEYAISTKNEELNATYRGNGFTSNMHCGWDVLSLYDENGICYTYKLTATPVYNQGTNFFPYGSDTENLISSDYSRVHLNADGTISWYRTDNQIWIYGQNGLIKRMEDLAGNGIDFNYEGEYIKSISYKGILLYSLEYKQNRLTKITNARDPSDYVEYEYHTDGYLWQSRDTEGDKVTFNYDTSKRLIKITKPDGEIVLINYDAYINGEYWASSTINENGYKQLTEYSFKTGDDTGITTTYTEDGIKTVYTWDAKTQKTKSEQYPDGSERIYKYDDAGNIETETWCGDTTTYTYDEWGNRSKIEYSDGTTEEWVYDHFLLQSYKDRDGIVVSYTYDNGKVTSIQKGNDVIFSGRYTNGRLIESTDASGVVTTYEYDDIGNVTERTTAEQLTETFVYDGRNRITSYKINGGHETTYDYSDPKKVVVTTPEKLRTIYTYDCRKDLVQVDETDLITGETRTTKYKYDYCHNLLKITNPDFVDAQGNAIPLVEYTYTKSGKVKTVTYRDGKDEWITTYTYDIYDDVHESGRTYTGNCTGLYTTKNGIGDCYVEYYAYIQGGLVSAVQTAEDRITKYGYDSWNRVKTITNAADETIEYELSPAGRLKSETTAYGGEYSYYWETGNLAEVWETPKPSEKVTYTYYENGAVESVTDRLGNKTEYFYDSLGNLERTVSPERIIWYSYDILGRITGQYVTDTNVTAIFTSSSLFGHSQMSTTLDTSVLDSYTTYSYSDDGRTITVTAGGLYQSTIKLNAFGETVSQTDGEGNTVSYEYDSLGHMIKSIDGYGKATTCEYNALGQVSKVTYRDGTSVSYVYDQMGNVTEIIDAEGTAAKYFYDGAGRLVKAEVRGNAVTEYKYDKLDRVIEVKTAGQVTAKYTYTTRGRLINAIDAQGEKYLYEYDEFGRLLKETNRLNDSSTFLYDEESNLKRQTDFEGNATRYEYDAVSRTKTTYYADGTSIIYEYTPSGNIKSVSGNTGIITYTYNKAGLLTSQNDISAGETTYYSYNNAGNKTAVESDSRTIRYGYGKNGETVFVSDETNGTEVQLQYDIMGRETKRTYANGVVQETGYDSLGRTIFIKQTDTHGNIVFAEAYVYKNGQRMATIDNARNITWYEYNAFCELEQVLYPYSASIEEEARKEAVEAGLPSSFAPVEWKYQTADELNLLRAAYQKILPDASLYGYYQPVNIDVPATERVWKESYTYDLNGNRETKTTALGTIYYTYDEENRLRYTGLNKLTNLNDDIGKRTTNRDTVTGTEWYASSDEGRYFTNGQKGILFTYDKNGNMLSSESTASLKYYEYDVTNRMILSSVTDFSDYSYTVTAYAYDAFGRRTLTQTAGETAKRTLYDGMGFEVLRQGATDGNGRLLPTDIAKGNYIQNGGYSASLWNDLFSEGMWGFGDGAYGSGQGAATNIEKYEIEDIFPLYANGEAVATYTEGLVYFTNAASMAGWTGNQNASIHGYYATYTETNYFASDTLGSVKVATGSTGAIIGYANYDVFGNPYERAGTLASDDLLYAYTGKTWDEKTGLSNYGFRDYAPQVARFTTVDPIRDGSNWYAYVHNDPANYIDSDGRISGYINDSKSVGGFGHSAMFVEIYDDNGNSIGFNVYEVGTVGTKGDKWIAFGVDETNDRSEIVLDNIKVLSYDNLDGAMGSAAGSLISGSVSASGSNVAVASGIGLAGSIAGGAVLESIDTLSGVFVRTYSTYEEMMNAPENFRYDNVIRFDTDSSQDMLIMETAEETGSNFGKYNLFTNNCTQQAANALSAGGVNTTSFLVPNMARNYIKNHNPGAVLEDWSKKECTNY